MKQGKEKIDVVIPFNNSPGMTLDCIKSMHVFGGDLINEVLLVSNNSSRASVDEVSEGIKKYANVKIVEYNKPFNYQKINNWAIHKTMSETILMINNDTELVEASRGLLEEMYLKAQQPKVGMVGCLLLYGDQRHIQHAGVRLEPGGLAGHYYQKQMLSVFSDKVSSDKPLTAVTGAVSMIQRKKFEKVGGFDEKFIIGGGDVDLCIRLNKQGFQTWYVSGGNPPKYILHKESISRKGLRMPYSDFYNSYKSYVLALDQDSLTDPFSANII